MLVASLSVPRNNLREITHESLPEAVGSKKLEKQFHIDKFYRKMLCHTLCTMCDLHILHMQQIDWSQANLLLFPATSIKEMGRTDRQL